MDATTKQQYLADDPPTVVPLSIKPHFEALNSQEKLYAHWISRASFSGTRIVLRQVSHESEPIYDLIIALHKSCGGDYASLEKKAGLSDEDIKHYLSYAAMFLGNSGNYKSFGDSKFIPRLSKDKFTALIETDPTAVTRLKTAGGIQALYESATGLMHLGYPSQGHLSTYYPNSPDITVDEIEYVSTWLADRKLLPENTRLVKNHEGNFECLISSAVNEPKKRDTEKLQWELEGPLKGKWLTLVYGDHSKEMKNISESLTEASKVAANQHQKDMQTAYVSHFHDGSMQSFLESQRQWIRDKGPTVECNIGFIETYRDPHGIRGEWEGFVAMVNKERTRAFGKLVESAPSQIPKLPWPKEFEKDKFLSPDFTSLEVLTFAGSGIPAGINIPNADIIRQTEGFKNVSLGNVLSAKAPDEKVPFIRDEDMDMYKKNSDLAFEVQVGLHELLGHGCGKLLQETAPGKYNFDVNNPPISPITNKPITTWYKPEETWGSVFGGLGPSYEECRAECVAMALSCDYGILEIFGIGDGKEDIDSPAGSVLHAAYLQMARAGIAALQYWDPASRKWGQAHMQARHAILKVFLSAGPKFCRLDYKETSDGISDLTIHMDKTKIASHGRPAVEKFLQKLQVYKATADLKAGRELFEGITTVDEWFAEKVRPEVLRRAQPRKVFVQANTVVEDGEARLKEYPATAEGMIQSFAEREYI
ncbi:dipeptidyl peptidase III [Myriangium duriaei CBS 260.36]|uniref:Dipeptidyl peptidase 3 n=1 Tax=Myriangium duriaei CBS 260.36 TaxID=1168546 RepID=A0A9P4J5P1_9PEZI|nr:dipeptidyl peptidase III [Myriangium duriaei CBS 260.36]